MRILVLPRTSILRWAADARRVAPRIALAVALLLVMPVTPAVLAAQDTTAVGPYARAAATWIALAATPGFERFATDRVMSAVEGWTRDRSGNLIKRVGDGSPRRVLACGIDESGYAVSEITDDGYLRLHMNGNGRHAALWDQYHEGQRVLVEGVDRANPGRVRHVPGVIATRSNHLWRRRVNDETPSTVENLWVDIGARSKAEAERMGIELLDPVVRDWPEWTFADEVSGPGAANRAGCAAIAAAAASSNRAANGETVYLISVQSGFSWTGLTSAISRLGRVDSLFIVSGDVGGNRTAPHSVRAPWPATSALDLGAIGGIGIPSRYTGTLVESVKEADLESLHRAVAAAAGLGSAAPAPIQLAHGWTAAPPIIIRDSLSRYADLLSRLTDVYAVSGFEQPMRDVIQPLLPAWARDMVTVDTAGNLILAMGPDKDTAVFVAHMDEIGFLVSSVAADGTVSLRPRGTFFPFLWEGQTALLHRPDDKIPPRDGKLGCSASREGPLRGVFVPRDSSADRNPKTLTAWFGRSASELAAAGVVPGAPLTSYKCSARLGETRFAARSIDDRAGVTSLLLALDEIDPAKLDHKVIFVWSVREEGGLEGAKVVAATLGPSVHRVHAIDTFVSSDSPVESRLFAYAPIGQGALLRSLDNSSVTPPEEIDRALRIARAQGIPLQTGVTNGGNDGSEFAKLGAVNVSLAWPLRYSHSPAEVMDLRDLRSLTRIVAALAKSPATPVSPPRIPRPAPTPPPSTPTPNR
jgi:putative aminopeptidase